MPIAVAALERGKHVLCEKPLGRNVSEAQRMVDAARVHYVVLKTGFNHRHHPAIWKAHELCTSGAIGPLMFLRCVYGHGGRPGYDKEWRADPDLAGGGEFREAIGYMLAGDWIGLGVGTESQMEARTSQPSIVFLDRLVVLIGGCVVISGRW